MAIDHSDHYEINSGNLHAGFYLNKKLPYTKHDCLYQDDQKQLTILKAGAIYNRISLLSELSKDLTLSDTELICHLFRKYGPRFVNRLNGGFAICIYDSRIHKVFLFRDHVGIYPLAYKIENGYLIFSSDIISLSRVFYNPENFNNDFLVDLFKVIIYKTVPDKNVVQLLPGTFLEFSFNETKLIKYWNPGDVQEDKKIKKLEFLTEIKYLLENSISIRSDYRFQAGSHVSGGLDSGIVSVIARKNFSKQKDFFGFSWTPFESPSIENKGDERDLVNKICQKAGIIPIFTKLSEAEYIKAIPNYYEHSANIYEDIVRSTASTHGINLIFSGFGGDEFLSKADSGILSDLFFRLHWKLLLKKYPLKHPRKLFNKLIYNVMFPWIGCLDPSSQRMYRQITEYLKDEHKKYNREQLRHLHFIDRGGRCNLM